MQTLETEHLMLHPFTRSDVENYYRIYWQIASDHGGEGPAADAHPSLEDIRAENEHYLSFANYQFLQPFGRWMIVLKSGEQNIGVFHLVPQLFPPEIIALCSESQSFRFGALEVVMGCALTRPYRRYGYATEATQRVISYGFETIKLQRILAETDLNNTASINGMKKVGVQIISPPDSKQVISIIESGG